MMEGDTNGVEEVERLKAELDTVGDCVRWAEGCFERAELHFGHGTDNAWDEALHLVFGLSLIHISEPTRPTT